MTDKQGYEMLLEIKDRQIICKNIKDLIEKGLVE